MAYKAVVFDQAEVLQMARDGASDAEIAAHHDCKESSVSNRCKKALARGRLLMSMDIKKAQLELARTGNSAMLTFLGKEILNQSGKPTEGHEEEVAPAEKLPTSELHKLLGKMKS